MKSVQEIFDIVINHGHFSPRVEISRTSPYMCRALDVAALNGVITRSEEHKAAWAIHEYLKPTRCVSLEAALQQSYLPTNFERRLHLYRNWADRPTLAPKETQDLYIEEITNGKLNKLWEQLIRTPIVQNKITEPFLRAKARLNIK